MTKEYSLKEFLQIIEKYNNIDRQIIKRNMRRIYNDYGFKNKDVITEFNYKRTKVNSWTSMSVNNIPTFEDALRIAVHFGFDIREYLRELGGDLDI